MHGGMARQTSEVSYRDMIQDFIVAFRDSNSHDEGPKIHIEMDEFNTEIISGHRFARITCQLQIGEEKSGATQWRLQRRLCTLRKDLHDTIKTKLGDREYDLRFHPDFKFARAGGFGVPGNLGRVRHWLARLATQINQGNVPIDIVRNVLEFMVQPSFDTDTLPWALRGETAPPGMGTPIANTGGYDMGDNCPKAAPARAISGSMSGTSPSRSMSQPMSGHKGFDLRNAGDYDEPSNEVVIA